MLIRQLSPGQSAYITDSRYGESRIAYTVCLNSNAYHYPGCGFAFAEIVLAQVCAIVARAILCLRYLESVHETKGRSSTCHF